MSSRNLWVTAVVAGLLIVAMSTDAQAQRGRGGQGGFGRGGFGGGGFGGGFGGGSLVDVAQRSDVQKELELLEDQTSQIEQIAQKQRDGMREVFGQIRDIAEDQRGERMRELFAKATQDTENALEEALLPHQMKRLRQLSVQLRSRGGVVRALTSDEIAEEVGISEAKIDELRAANEEAEAQLREEIAKLRAKADEKILATLSAEQRSKWNDMVGEPFEFEAEERGPGFGGFGGRGGPGGPGGRPEGRPDGDGGNRRPRGRDNN